MSSRRIVIRGGDAVLAADFIPSEAELAAAADAADLSSVSGFVSAGRRAERLAWRRLLRDTLADRFGRVSPDGLRVEYSDAGAPRLVNFPDIDISVSHCRDMAAVVVSRTSPPLAEGGAGGVGGAGDSSDVRPKRGMRGPCGVDIERMDRNFDRVAARYLSAAERALSSDPRLPAAVWCAKECLFKMHGRRGLDLLRDIAVTGIDFSAGTVSGRIAGNAEIVMRMLFPDEDHIVVFSL